MNLSIVCLGTRKSEFFSCLLQGTKWLHFPQLGSRKVRSKYGERGGAIEKATNHIPLTQHSRNMWRNLALGETLVGATDE